MADEKNKETIAFANARTPQEVPRSLKSVICELKAGHIPPEAPVTMSGIPSKSNVAVPQACAENQHHEVQTESPRTETPSVPSKVSGT